MASGAQLTTEFAADGSRVFRLSIQPGFSYQAFPVALGAVSAQSLRDGMDAMRPRP